MSGDARDHAGDDPDLLGPVGEIAHEGVRALRLGRRPRGLGRRLRHPSGDLLDGDRHLLGGRGDALHAPGGLLRGPGDARRPGTCARGRPRHRLGGRLHLGRGRGDARHQRTGLGLERPGERVEALRVPGLGLRFLRGRPVHGGLGDQGLSEDFDGPGHLADLVCPLEPGYRLRAVALSQHLHPAAEPVERPRDAAPDQERADHSQGAEPEQKADRREGERLEGGLDVVGVGPRRDQDVPGREPDGERRLRRQAFMPGPGIEIAHRSRVGLLQQIDQGPGHANAVDPSLQLIAADESAVGNRQRRSVHRVDGDVVGARVEAHGHGGLDQCRQGRLPGQSAAPDPGLEALRIGGEQLRDRAQGLQPLRQHFLIIHSQPGSADDRDKHCYERNLRHHST